MAVTTTNLGVITAYGDAVAAGYTGTKAEWQALMASYATVGQQSVDAKNAAVAAKDTAVAKATEATTAANTATTKANEASASAQSIAQSASQIAQNTSDISELKEDTTQLKSDLSDLIIQDATKYITDWSQGYIRNNGTIGTSTTECVCGWKTFDTGKVYVTVKSGYKCRVARYTSTEGTHGVFDAFVVNPHVTGSFSFDADSTKYYKIDLMNTGETTLAPSNVPSDCIGYYQTHWTDKSLSIANKCADAKATGDEIHKVYTGRNVLDSNALTLNKYINNSTGAVGSSESYAVTDFIPVSENDSVICVYDAANVMSMRYVAAYDENKTILTSKGADTVNTYTVPSGVSYIRISANKKRITSKLACIYTDHVNGVNENYEKYVTGQLYQFAKKNNSGLSDFSLYPLSTLPEYILNNLAYKPIGVLSKGYICLVSDDGDADIATYTIPMLIQKDVPATFAVMKSSKCWNDNTIKATVIDAVENHGCVLAQHGGSTWDQENELTLNTFFDDEKVFWDALGVSVYGAVCPAHNINKLIQCVAGGRFGCLRTGYDDAVPRYTNYTNGPRSNLYALCSQSALDGTLDTQKAILDACLSNCWLRIIHWHENEMDASDKTQLEGIIDYAKQIGLTFITMKDIPTII